MTWVCDNCGNELTVPDDQVKVGRFSGVLRAAVIPLHLVKRYTVCYRSGMLHVEEHSKLLKLNSV